TAYNAGQALQDARLDGHDADILALQGAGPYATGAELTALQLTLQLLRRYEFSRAQADRRVADFSVEIMERGIFMGSVSRVRKSPKNFNRSPLQVGWAVLELSKLKIACSQNLTLPVEFDLLGDLDAKDFEVEVSPEALEKLKELQGRMGALSDECANWVLLSVVCLAVKKHSILLSDGKQIQKAKGVPRSVRSATRHQDYLKIHEENSTRHDSFTQLRSYQHQIFIVEQQKKTFSVMNDKAFQLTKENCRQLGHWRNAYLGVWMRLKGADALLEKILEFVRGPAPMRNPKWGELAKSLSR
ncbi:unnamed protein product, partial [Symbiodinium sp. CCMP2456]